MQIMRKIAQTAALVGKVVDSLNSSSAVDAPSIHAVNEALTKKQDSLMHGTYSGDIDECKEVGCHYCNFANITNAPYTSGYGWIEVKRSGETFIQEIYRHSTSGVSEKVVREFANSKWYPWRKILTAEI